MNPPPFLSIVMPCFNVASYLETAVCSVVQQECQFKFEILLVEDGSNDTHTLTLCEELASACPEVRLVRHPFNKGLSAARNTGLAEASGTYVIFMDPDDALRPGLFKEIQSVAEQHKPNVVLWGAVEEHYDSNGRLSMEKEVVVAGGCFVRPDDIAREILVLENATLFGYAWNKAYSRDFLLENNLAFENIRLIEDVLFNIQVFERANCFAVLDGAYYRYARRLSKEESLTAKFIPDYFELNSMRVEKLCELFDSLGFLDQPAKEALGAIYFRYALSALWRNRNPQSGMSGAARKAWLDRFYELPLTNLLLESAKPQGKLAIISTLLFKARAKYALLALAAVVDWASRYGSGLMIRARQSR